ncbi:MAG: heparan-alpha-glucosaminide N-acetyltransferase domain-containing protein [Saprospiraceae bacterium]
MQTSNRLLSLDVFRGLTIAFMILVNCPGDWGNVYGPLLHAEWHGCTPTDLVFPFFLFIVGIAIAYSLEKRKAEGADRKKIYRKILSRTLWIIGIGLLLSGAFKFNLATWRIPGVLTRIGLVYGICALIYMVTSTRQQLWVAVGCLLAYWGLMTLIPVPGQGYASLEMGKDLGAWLDRLLLDGHLWSQAKTWDPEGLLSTIPSVGTCLAGVLRVLGCAGKWRSMQNGRPCSPLASCWWWLDCCGGRFSPSTKKYGRAAMCCTTVVGPC